VELPGAVGGKTGGIVEFVEFVVLVGGVVVLVGGVVVFVGGVETRGGLRVTKPVGPKNLLKKLKVLATIDEVASNSAITIATLTKGSSKNGIQISVKLSKTTVPEEVELPDEASPKNIWRASKYCTHHRTQSFHSAFVQLLGLGLD